jgi:RHS repeat-associated protein
MRCFFTQAGTSEPSIYAQYLYAGGTRIKKLTRTSGGGYLSITYIDGIFEYQTDGTDEQNTLHIMDDQTRVATLRVGDSMGDSTPAVKYVLADHLGSSNVLIDDSGSLVSFEEYYPFGETSFGSYAKKRYRYVGKEKDEESGLYYYGARYFQPWSCRFISVDPLAAKYPFYTPYQYAGNKPVTKIDRDGLEEKGKSPQENNVEQPKKSIEELVTIDPEYATEPVKLEIEQVKDMKRKDGESRDDFKKRKAEAQTKWDEYNEKKAKYDFLQKAKSDLVNAPEGSKLAETRKLIEGKQVQVELQFGTIYTTALATTAEVLYNNPNGTQTLKKYEITFDWDKIQNGTGSYVTNEMNVEQGLAFWNNERDKDLGISFRSFTDRNNSIRPTFSGIIAHEWGHVFTGLSTFKNINAITPDEIKAVKDNEIFAREFERDRLFAK